MIGKAMSGKMKLPMSLECVTTRETDEGILPILYSYPSFPDRKVKTLKRQKYSK